MQNGREAGGELKRRAELARREMEEKRGLTISSCYELMRKEMEVEKKD
jgi:hypothetical protein